MNRGALYAYICLRPIGLLIHRYFFQFIERFEAIDDFTEHSIFPVEVCLFTIGNEKLRSVGVRSSTGHGEDAALAMLNGQSCSASKSHLHVRVYFQMIVDFILNESATRSFNDQCTRSMALPESIRPRLTARPCRCQTDRPFEPCNLSHCDGTDSCRSSYLRRAPRSSKNQDFSDQNRVPVDAAHFTSLRALITVQFDLEITEIGVQRHGHLQIRRSK